MCTSVTFPGIGGHLRRNKHGGLTNVPSQFVDVIEPGLELAN